MRLRNDTLSVYLLVLAVTIAFVGSCAEDESETNAPTTDESSEPRVPSRSPEFQGKNLVNGRNFSSDEMKGYVQIINFWATWCGPCQQEVPDLVELQSKYGDSRFAVIGMSLDRGGEAVVENFMAKKGINYPVILATEQIKSHYESAVGAPIRGIPTSIVVNRDGAIVSVHVGFRTRDQFEQEIRELL